MSTQVFIFGALNGVGIGMIYFILSIGLTMIFGLMQFVNFAHGAFYMVSAYAAFAIAQWTGSVLPALLISPLLAAIFALVSERVLLQRTYNLPHEAQILMTFALAILAQETVTMIFGTLGKNVPVPEMFNGVVILGGFVYPSYRLFVVAVAVVVAVVMWLAIERTRLGAMLRAAAENAEMVGLLGFDSRKIFMGAFAFGGALAGLAGALAAPLRGVEPLMGREALAIAFVVVILGGLGSFSGALLAALLIGITQSLMSMIWPGGAHLMIYGVMTMILAFRPTGLMGRS
ncbi:ABC transporter permease [Bradyrhizobium sp. UNPF46]|uniref:branched-chain amino acid ABC transporter permease n=1 Tax=Bradyrhizobium sp. UNPF46 TaxID=1141168 RepID=UPI0011535CEC|nr:branched-chain amino acid ABC transporter permease [Bradyrhizobium sp. UNPF46]TQF42584.1 ABC transporter permease [Bradyrhizobium sp. UNPF46]